MRSSGQRAGAGRPGGVRGVSVRRSSDPACAVPPVQSFLFGHSRAEVVYDCR
ncbi:hypothetical protein [Actinomadura rugatobispora]|uniref:DUF397 domain-containing protein n=1 Tax=Actinomadura rugatobispora TaxID=1994 RepID=A0ABW1A199_9ACTN